MKTRSAKAKGRRAVAELRSMLLASAPELAESDIEVKPTSVPGEDLWLSDAARRVFPLAWEVKNTERMNMWAAIEQAESHARKHGWKPAVAFRRNRSDLYVALRLADFLQLIRPQNSFTRRPSVE